MKIFHRGKVWRWLGITLLIMASALGAFVSYMVAMPGKSFSGALPPLTVTETEIKDNLAKHIFYLADEIGERNVIAYEPLQKTAQYIEDSFKKLGYEVKSQEYTVQMRKVRNLIAEIPGGAKANEIVVIGAHYDTVYDCPGADDNSSGVAALLELARLLKDSHPARTVRFVAFVNEEPPWFQTDDMGSLVYAEQAHKLKDNIVAAVSIETIGMYSDAEGSQQYPAGFKSLYPSKGNFIAFIGNLGSRSLVRDAVSSFRASVKFPSEGSAVPTAVPGVGWSDHWSFWQEGYPAIMITDTAPFRNPNYHQPTDKPDTLNYERMARVVHGLVGVVVDLGK
ncbi:MAG TPA: M20/M25/M40 family metallo-hydrolase [Candidatus Binatia bacterium]|nr:M20/M25/M40 family metallo-hydrolase [Candidatus Binatia bacterium]